MSDVPPADPGQECTKGVTGARVRHIAGESYSLCNRWSVWALWPVTGRDARRAGLPMCQRCKELRDGA